MKYIVFIPALAILALSSCDNAAGSKTTEATETVAEDIQPGKLMAADSMDVNEDELNNSTFAVQVISTEHSGHYGVYKVAAHYGHNEATSEFTMPRGGEQLKPVIKKSSQPYTYDIGFYYNGEPDFYDYYEVSANRGEIKMKYKKAYSLK